MIYSMLLWPHANARYYQAIKPLAAAELELLLRAAGIGSECRYASIGGVDFLCFDAEALTERQVKILSGHSQIYFLSQFTPPDRLTPLFPRAEAYLGHDLPGILKYKGKTNEAFTHLLTNLALYSSKRRVDHISLLDPMCSRGTTLFDAANRGFSSTGIDVDGADISEAENFFKRYLVYHQFKHTLKSDALTLDRGKSLKRKTFEFAATPEEYKANDKKTLSLIHHDAKSALAAFKKQSFDLAVMDLPYGVQHAPGGGKHLSLEALLEQLAPAIKRVLKKGGACAMSFNTHTLKRDRLREILKDAGLTPMEGGLYDGLEHWVEQAVLRDAVVAVADQ